MITFDGSYFIGLMSGTSVDGIDGALMQMRAASDGSLHPHQLARASVDMPPDLRLELLALNESGSDELHRAALAANALVRCYADTVAQLLHRARIAPTDIVAIGAHGQTVRHRPQEGYTLQLNAPALLAELAQIAVVADFRTRDVAAGGQGAPLAPIFHHAVFSTNRPRAVLNLGGIANVTALRPGLPPIGFDTGPANALLDLWCLRHTGQPFDADGAWGRTGTCDDALLAEWIASDAWLAAAPPKSTGRDHFNAEWLDQRIPHGYAALATWREDIQATLVQLTAATVAQAVAQQAPDVEDVLVCGGGSRNGALMRALGARLNRPIALTDTAGVAAQDAEAMAFAWLAYAHCARIPAGIPAVTGVRGPRVLGAYYPA
ncbi:anhydro-N-acetylmuramic acid kinase [Schauerella aestuarii]|uniref:anhydro-N-acetylmuramic acid kinase n=1 Tax=Schauerella aestuarii TaxID=2511204 RepID=UPI00136C653A|nr:anhydro-N-acetylmuramic acid kinase [Achromobacter aestuarii]MYZ42760.1 anhydro-N-acetylmuramic acid kinase [Achromobacter aestuarii]